MVSRKADATGHGQQGSRKRTSSTISRAIMLAWKTSVAPSPVTSLSPMASFSAQRPARLTTCSGGASVGTGSLAVLHHKR